jgi:hypothetical protein
MSIEKQGLGTRGQGPGKGRSQFVILRERRVTELLKPMERATEGTQNCRIPPPARFPHTGQHDPAILSSFGRATRSAHLPLRAALPQDHFCFCLSLAPGP